MIRAIAIAAIAATALAAYEAYDARRWRTIAVRLDRQADVCASLLLRCAERRTREAACRTAPYVP